MARRVLRLGALIFGCILLLGMAAARAGDGGYFRIATGATGGTYFPIGSLIASAISNPPGSRDCDDGGSCGVPGLIAVGQASKGSVQNVALIAGGTVESGLGQADVAYMAYFGLGPFKGASPPCSPSWCNWRCASTAASMRSKICVTGVSLWASKVRARRWTRMS